jgi:NAD(P)-dependent dehydrogenase (short-subunit alcohol dehydrogenase family)
LSFNDQAAWITGISSGIAGALARAPAMDGAMPVVAFKTTDHGPPCAVQRRRMVNAALGDIRGQRVHAPAIKASAPGE